MVARWRHLQPARGTPMRPNAKIESSSSHVFPWLHHHVDDDSKVPPASCEAESVIEHDDCCNARVLVRQERDHAITDAEPWSPRHRIRTDEAETHQSLLLRRGRIAISRQREESSRMLMKKKRKRMKMTVAKMTATMFAESKHRSRPHQRPEQDELKSACAANTRMKTCRVTMRKWKMREMKKTDAER